MLIIQGNSYAQPGTWTQLTNSAPDPNFGEMLLLTDGTVICHDQNFIGYGTGWDRLTPDSTGSYINGTWSTITDMNYDRLYFSSQVLPSGQVYVAGGEYGTGQGIGEVYDPVADIWNVCGAVPNGLNISDCNSAILPNGTILQSAIGTNNDLIYDPSTNSYTSDNSSMYSPEESVWLKLPDNSILFVGFGSTNSNRYIPSSDTWVNDATLPVQLYDGVGEAGPAFMLPNGKAIFFGAASQNVIYTPSGNSSPGTWTAAPDFPTINGSPMGQPDAPAAMMVNGKIICAVSPLGTAGFIDEFRPPVYFVEYDYSTNTFTQVTSIIPGTGTDSIQGAPCYETSMLDLPDGNVLLSYFNSYTYYIYTPSGSALVAGKPTIDGIIPDTCPSYKLTGKLFNGITEGNAYGDDWQMATNYPIVRLSKGTNVYYAKTTFWNRIGAVQTGNLEDTVVFTPPSSIPGGTYSLVVVANGNPSSPVSFNVPGVSVIPSSPSFCSGSSVNLTVSGATTYIWSPSTGLTSTSGTSVTANPTVTTTYTITGTNSAGCSATNTVIVNVNPNPTITASANPDSSCSGESSTLKASGGSTYTWSPSTGLSETTGATVTASPTVTTTYTINGSSEQGCKGTTSLALKVLPTPSLTVSNDTAISSGKSAQLHAKSTSSVTWSPSTGLSCTNCNNPIATTSVTTTYTATATEGACEVSDNVIVTVTTAGIKQVSSINDELTIYPNPFNNEIFIKINSSVEDVADWSLQTIDVLGRTVYTMSSLNYTNEIDLSDLLGGVYFITVINKTSRAVVPVVKQ